jgi:hypothetical protein
MAEPDSQKPEGDIVQFGGKTPLVLTGILKILALIFLAPRLKLLI